MVDEDAQQAVFRAAEGNGRSLPVEQVPPDRVEPPVAEAQDPARLADLEIGRQHARAPEHGLDAGEQLACGEGFAR